MPTTYACPPHTHTHHIRTPATYAHPPLVMCWDGLKPEAEPGPARLSPAQPGPCCGLCAGLGRAPDFSGPKPGLRPGLSTHLYYILSSRPVARPDRPAARCVGIEHQFFCVLCRSCLVTGSHAARPYGPTLRPRCPPPSTEISLPKRLNRASLLPPPRTSPYDRAA